MATQKPLSTISYNTEPFLREKLDRLYDKHIISSWWYIKHIGEDGGKDHIHLFISPNTRIDPMALVEEFDEFVQGESLPRKCKEMRSSVKEDWLLYAVHDEQYLKMKYANYDSKDGKIPYSWEDIVHDERSDIQDEFIRAKASLKVGAPAIVNRLKTGTSALDLVGEGANPLIVNACMRLTESKIISDLRKDLEFEQYKFKLLEEALAERHLQIECIADDKAVIKKMILIDAPNFTDEDLLHE